MNDSQHAAAFIRKVTELAYRLASRDIVVSSLSVDWSHFGSWKLETQRDADAARYGEAIKAASQGRESDEASGPEVVRVIWYGRDGELSVEASPTRFLCAPTQWKLEYSKEFGLEDNAKEDAFRFVEDYLIKRLGK